MKRPARLALVIAMVAVVGAMSGLPAAWGQETRDLEVVVKRRAIFVNEDGEVTELKGEGDGHSFSWALDGHVLELKGTGEASFVYLSSLGLGGGFLGVDMVALTDSLRVHFGVPEGAGVMISEVVPGSPAGIAGLEAGDIVTAIDGAEVVAPRHLSHAVRSKRTDELVDLEVWRDGKLMSVMATVAERERPIVKLGRHGSKITLEHLDDLEYGERDRVIHLDGALGQMREYFEGDEWQARVQRVGSTDWALIEARMKALEKHIDELEEKLQQAQP